MPGHGQCSSPGEPVGLAVGQPHAAGQHDQRDGLHRRAAATRSATTAPPCAPTTAARRGPASPPAPRRTSTRRRRSRRTSSIDPRRRRLRPAPLRRRRQDVPQAVFVLAETNCPDPVAASYFVTPQVGYLLLRDGNVLRTTDGGQTLRPRHRHPRHAGERRAAAAHARRRDLHHARRGHRLPQRLEHRVPHDRRGRDRGRRSPTSTAGSVQRMKAVNATTFYAFGPDTLLRSIDAGQTWQAAPAAPGARSPASAARRDDLACSPPTAATSCCGPRTAGRPRADHRLAPRRSSRPASRTPTAPWRPATAARPPSPTTAASNYAPIGGDIAGLVPVRPAARPGAEHRARARRPRPARPHDRQRRDVEGDQRRHLGRHAGHVVHQRRRRLRARPARRAVPHRQRRRELAADRSRHHRRRRRP